MVQINSNCRLAQIRYWSESSNRFHFRKECKPQKKILRANSLTSTLPPPQSPLFVFEWSTLTGSRLFTFLGSVFAQIFGHIVVLRVKELSNTNLFALRHMLREKVSLPFFVWWGGWGERKRERAFYFFEDCYFYRDTQREPLRRREKSTRK